MHWLIAFAALASLPAPPNHKVESAELRADSNQAWVEVKLARRFLNGKEARRPPTSVAVRVPGLQVDSATGGITLTKDDRTVDCASGACTIDARIVDERLVVSVDAR